MDSKSFYVFILFTFLFSFHTLSQVEKPALWNSFINDPTKNLVDRDTFLLQSFEGRSVDNWSFSSEDGMIQNVSLDGIKGQRGNYSFIIPSESTINFEPFDPSVFNYYKDVRIGFDYAAKNLPANTTIYYYCLRIEDDQYQERLVVDTQKEIPIGSYGENMGKPNPQQAKSAYAISFKTPALPKDAYFCVDDVFARGDIATYSLFTGKGDWQDTLRWSHIPPERKRNGLINGDVTVSTSITGNNISISQGSLHIAENKHVEINNLSLHEADAWLSSEGSIRINGQVNVYKTFDSKDEWYFISFPFDVYKEGLDPDFEWKDDTPNQGGNYFYVLTYNSERRQIGNSLAGNWDVLSPSQIGNQPVFEKNKGYLVALDQKADKQTMRFSSTGEIPGDFGKAGFIHVQTSSSPHGKEEDYGWNLCGNPYPAPLSLSQIPNHALLDDYIYVYDGITYQPYAIGSDYMLPPFSAFFVKAKADVNLELTKASATSNGTLISVSAPFRSGTPDPKSGHNPVSNTEIGKPQSSIKGNILSIRNLSEQGRLIVYNTHGKVVLHKTLPSGSYEMPVRLSNGIYILTIESPVYSTQHKCIINQ